MPLSGNYPQGYHPEYPAKFEGTRSYRNRLDGIFFHNSKDLIVSGGLLADNRIQVDFDAADNVVLNGTLLAGRSQRFYHLLGSQSIVAAHQNDAVFGVQLHSHVLDTADAGATITNLSVDDFDAPQVKEGAVVTFDPGYGNRRFDYWTSIQGMEITGQPVVPIVDFGPATTQGIFDAYVVDVDSSLSPLPVPPIAPSSIVVMSSAPGLLAFVNRTACLEYGGEALYCQGRCLQTVSFSISPIFAASKIVLRIEETGTGRYFEFEPDLRQDKYGEYYEEGIDFRDVVLFSIALPSGNYEAAFLPSAGSSSLDEAMWPTFVEFWFQKSECRDTIMSRDNIHLLTPAFDEDMSCQQLIRGGDMEWDAASVGEFGDWLHQNIGMERIHGGGLAGSAGLADGKTITMSGSVGQFLDMRCLAPPFAYEVEVWFKLIDLSKGSGNVISDCSIGGCCPAARLRIQKRDEYGEVTEWIRPVANQIVASVGNWQLLSGYTEMAELVGATRVFFFIKRGCAKSRLVVDNVSMQRVV